MADGGARRAARTRRVRSDLGELPALAAWVRRVAADVGAGTEATSRLELCVHEAVANVVEHGPTGGERREIVVTLMDGGDDVVATIEDDGPPFDPLAAPPREKPRTLAEAPLRGYGLPILRALTTRLAYERASDRNRLVLAVRKHPG